MSTSNPFETVREKEAAVETTAERDDRIGAASRMLLALARDDQPDVRDLEILGLPVGLTFDESPAEGST